MSPMNRRDLVKTGGTMFVLGAASGSALFTAAANAQESVKLGLLHSLSGTIAIAEASLVDAEKMAIDEINAAGG
jgi:urea transport system substrate-binding protein